MPPTDRTLWVLNFFRNSELHGALLMGKLARTLTDQHLLVHVTRHCATEARHAAMISDTIEAIGGSIDPRIPPVQEHYSSSGGVPASIVDLLVLSEVLEHRVLHTYRQWAKRDDLGGAAQDCLLRILGEMEAEEEDQHARWLHDALDRYPQTVVRAAESKWRTVDATVAEELERMVAARFPEAG